MKRLQLVDPHFLNNSHAGVFLGAAFYSIIVEGTAIGDASTKPIDIKTELVEVISGNIIGLDNPYKFSKVSPHFAFEQPQKNRIQKIW